jgi:hypothetical protein
MSCLRCLCLFVYSGVLFFCFCLRPVCLVCPILTVSLGLSICYCPFGVLKRLFSKCMANALGTLRVLLVSYRRKFDIVQGAF